MSSTSPQAAAASSNSQWQAQLAQMLSGVTLPELQKIIGSDTWTPARPESILPNGRVIPATEGHWNRGDGGGLMGMLANTDPNGQMQQDAKVKADAVGQLNQGYNQAQTGTKEAISYGALRSGEGRRSPGATSSALGMAATGLERDRTAALRNLEFASAQSSLSDYNKVLQLLGQGANTSLGLAQGFSGAQGAAIGGLSGNSQAGNVMGGAASGAALGTSIYPGWGTAIGAVVGGIYGLTQP